MSMSALARVSASRLPSSLIYSSTVSMVSSSGIVSRSSRHLVDLLKIVVCYHEQPMRLKSRCQAFQYVRPEIQWLSHVWCIERPQASALDVQDSMSGWPNHLSFSTSALSGSSSFCEHPQRLSRSLWWWIGNAYSVLLFRNASGHAERLDSCDSCDLSGDVQSRQ